MRDMTLFRLMFLSVLILGLVLTVPVYAQNDTKTGPSMTDSLGSLAEKCPEPSSREP